MNKFLKYLLLLLVIGLVGYKSIYIKKLSSLKKTNDTTFDASSFSKKLWEEKLPAKLDSAVELTTLLKAIETNPAEAFSKYSNAMGIGNYRYSLVKVKGIVAKINDDDVLIQFPQADSLMNIIVATEYIYGNAIRDASALVDLKDFTNAMDLNNISEELNKTVRTTLLPFFKKQVKTGDSLEAVGALEINKEHIKLNALELIPVRLTILPK